MNRKYEVTWVSIMPLKEVITPGNVVELDDSDPRTKEWLGDGCIVPVEEPERKKPGPKPKDKEGAE